MKKLFVSVPMRGKNEDEIKQSIKKMHKIAEFIFGEELEVIDSYLKDGAPYGVNEPVWYLGESIKLMAGADYFIGVKECHEHNGCFTETYVATAYGIPHYLVELD